jgi:cell division protein FtsZ
MPPHSELRMVATGEDGRRCYTPGGALLRGTSRSAGLGVCPNLARIIFRDAYPVLCAARVTFPAVTDWHNPGVRLPARAVPVPCRRQWKRLPSGMGEVHMQSHNQGPVRGQRRPPQPEGQRHSAPRAAVETPASLDLSASAAEAAAEANPASVAKPVSAVPSRPRDSSWDEIVRETFAHIKVVGIGGAGGNAVNRMIDAGVDGIEFVSVNTDAQALMGSKAPVYVRIGDKLTKGLGAGGRPEIGERAAEESSDSLGEMVRGADMIFITGGMGGGTGTGAAPVIAKHARAAGALTVGVVTKPFDFEGTRRRRAAEEGIARLRENVDALIVIPNQRLLEMVDAKTSIEEAFGMADDVLRQGIGGISDLITKPGVINLDFADVKTVMKEAGSALMAIGHGTGETRCIDAAQEAIESPLLEMNIQGATGVLYNITGGSSLTLLETSEAAEVIRAAVDEEAEIIYGTSIDPTLGDAVRITLIATGFDQGGGIFDSAIPRAPREPRPMRDREPERTYRPAAPPLSTPPRANSAGTSPASPYPEDDWVAESSIIKFLRER